LKPPLLAVAPVFIKLDIQDTAFGALKREQSHGTAIFQIKRRAGGKEATC
jgi:hypothetical protein